MTRPQSPSELVDLTSRTNAETLFRAGPYRRSTLEAHRPVHCRNPLSTKHFARWLTLWNTTVDQMYQGPTANRAKLQAARISTAMHRRLTGTGSKRLDELLQRAG